MRSLSVDGSCEITRKIVLATTAVLVAEGRIAWK